MAKCCDASCKKKAIAGFERDDINKSIICWCEEHERDLRSEAYGPGKWLDQEQLDEM